VLLFLTFILGGFLKNQILFFLIFISQSLFAQITFDSDFESGNLARVTVIDSVSFYVTTQEDTGPEPISSRWFYFRMSGVKDKEIRVLFTNSDVTKAMYSYDNETFVRFTDEEVPSSGLFFKKFEEDIVYVSFYTPYNYSYLQKRVNSWEKNSFVQIDTLGITPKGLPIQEVIVTDKSVPDDFKKNVWIHARTHPSETPSSWHFDGIMQELLSDKEVVNKYLKEIVFHMIPFTNPDGVYNGRSRVNYEGINLEENWDKSDEFTSEEVKILRARMKELNDEKPFSVFLNLHSQSRSYCTFWIHKSETTSEDFYKKEYQFSYLNLSDNPYFVKGDLRESNLRSIFPEAWLWNNYGESVMALTYETPYNNYFSNTIEPHIEVTNENLFEIGKRTIYAIAEYLQISHSSRYIMDNKDARFAGSQPVSYSVTNEFYGDDFSVLEQNTLSYAVFESGILPSENYDIAAWWPTNEGNSFETVFEITAGSNSYEVTKTQKANGGQWNYLTDIELNEEGIISIKLNSNSTGNVVADAFRIIYVEPVTNINEVIIPTGFNLSQNYPNPFNPTTTIRYSIPNVVSNFGSVSKVSLIVYDVLGREIATLVNAQQTVGDYEAQFNGVDLASGTYFYRLQLGDFVETKKMILMK
jgi:zinc carboxypeptidase/type IX secretion system substrate protein/carboxypeptidase M14-like protein